MLTVVLYCLFSKNRPGAEFRGNPKVNLKNLDITFVHKLERRGDERRKRGPQRSRKLSYRWHGPRQGQSCVPRSQEEQDSHLPDVNKG